jgi:hypothetical protein
MLIPVCLLGNLALTTPAAVKCGLDHYISIGGQLFYFPQIVSFTYHARTHARTHAVHAYYIIVPRKGSFF